MEGEKIPVVRVIDFDMPFFSMMAFMIKWALAAVPAIIILTVIMAMAFGVFQGVLLAQ